MKTTFLAALALLTLATPVLAAPGGRHGGDQRSERSSSALGDILISATERALIGEYYKSHAVEADSLPPGIRKKVARGKPLPPGIAKRFPDALSGQMRARPGYDFRTVGADVVLVEIASGVIVDIIKDILR